MIRVAAVGDVHYDSRPRKEFAAGFSRLAGKADIFLIAGDLTQSGTSKEARALVSDLSGNPVPTVAVLGNHDYHSNRQSEVIHVLRDAGVHVLEGGETATFKVGGSTVGVAGLKGFGGGFLGACVTEFGEPEMKNFAHHARSQAELLRSGLKKLNTDYRLVLLHFSPIDGTLLGEKREIYPFLGSYLLAEAIDEIGADAVFHGHAHHGVERGVTPGGVLVRNVALNVIRHVYHVYSFERRGASV